MWSDIGRFLLICALLSLIPLIYLLVWVNKRIKENFENKNKLRLLYKCQCTTICALGFYFIALFMINLDGSDTSPWEYPLIFAGTTYLPFYWIGSLEEKYPITSNRSKKLHRIVSTVSVAWLALSGLFGLLVWGGYIWYYLCLGFLVVECANTLWDYIAYGFISLFVLVNILALIAIVFKK